jgi:N-methylhydantoinase B/oxoprolinase/acetone carboxylase alpha subunit
MRVLRHDSDGAGRSPSGESIERDLQVPEDCAVSLITERPVTQPWGLWSGRPDAVEENSLRPAGGESHAERLPDTSTIRPDAGDIVPMLTPGGGRWAPAEVP